MASKGPLTGVRVIEMKGIGPAPYAGMLLADMGADVIVIERRAQHTGIGLPAERDIHSRGKRSVALNVKTGAGLSALLKLIEGADVLIEGFRPGVAERLGFGPEVCLQGNPALVFGRVTGWGQDGPLASTAGHDLNYLSLTGALAAIGDAEKPLPPLNLVGDYAGGSLFLVMGVLAALLQARTTGEGQVVDAAITDGTASLMSLFHSLQANGLWQTTRESNLLDGAAPHYRCYRTRDDRFVSVAALEPQFLTTLVDRAGLDNSLVSRCADPAQWPAVAGELQGFFAARTQAECLALFENSDACVAPVLDFTEAAGHPHNQARGTYVNKNGLVEPAAAPRFGAGSEQAPGERRKAGADTAEVLREAGFSDADIAALADDGALG